MRWYHWYYLFVAFQDLIALSAFGFAGYLAFRSHGETVTVILWLVISVSAGIYFGWIRREQILDIQEGMIHESRKDITRAVNRNLSEKWMGDRTVLRNRDNDLDS